MYHIVMVLWMNAVMMMDGWMDGWMDEYCTERWKMHAGDEID